MFSVKDKIICISGSSTGLGKAIAAAFAENGARVVISSFNKTELNETFEELTSKNFDIQQVVCDVSKDEECKALISKTVELYGKIDTMICNAGIDNIKPALDYTIDEWNKIIQVNLTGVYLCAKYAGIQMRKQGYGNIIVTSSVASQFGIPGLAPYASSKAAINQLVKTLAVELSADNIRVNAVAPGYINNIMNGVAFDNEDPYQKRVIMRTLMGRRGNVEEFTGAYIFLSSDSASYITGQVLNVDGGYSCW